MGKYQLLNKFRYKVQSNKAEIEKEYENRLNGYSTIRTNMVPTLMKKNGTQSKKYPIFFVQTSEINLLVSNVNKLSKEILKLISSSTLPKIAQKSFINSLLIDEIYFTNQIEGVKTDREQIGTIVGEVDIEYKKSKRLDSTIKLYNDSLKGRLIKIESPDDIKIIYDKLLDGEIPDDKRPDGINFRRNSVRIGTDATTVHVPPTTEFEIETAMAQLINFMNDDNLDETLKAIVTHFMFENTHPFYDGNGRTGRYLLSSYLSEKVDIFTGILISTAIHENVQKYYAEFKKAGTDENRADLTDFVLAMLEIITNGQETVISKLMDLQLQLADKNAKMTRDLENQLDHKYSGILYVFLQSGLFSTTDATGIKDGELITFMNQLPGKNKMSKLQVKKAINDLEEKGIIEEIKRRPKQHKLNAKYLNG